MHSVYYTGMTTKPLIRIFDIFYEHIFNNSIVNCNDFARIFGQIMWINVLSIIRSLHTCKINPIPKIVIIYLRNNLL